MDFKKLLKFKKGTDTQTDTEEDVKNDSTKANKSIKITNPIKWFDDILLKHFDGQILVTQYLDMRYKRVGLYTLDYDKSVDLYYENYIHIPRKDLPLGAVHCTGTKKDWYMDNTQLASYPKERELNAVFSELWRKNNYISDVFVEKWTQKITLKQVMMIGAVGLVAFAVLSAMM